MQKKMCETCRLPYGSEDHLCREAMPASDGGRAEDCPRRHTPIRRGDDFNCGVLGEDSLATAGIHVGDHLNAIECHGATLDEAQRLRERVLALLVQRDYRWNVATRPAVPGDRVVGICKGGHDSSETPCEYRAITEADVLELMKAVAAAQAEAQELRDELARVRELCPEVIAFAHLMQHKLNKDGEGWGRDSSGKRGWNSYSPQFLMDKLYEEVLELTIAIHEGDSAKSIRQEAADVGNIAMMLADVCGALSQPAEQHDPLAVSDHCPECSEPEPECVCGEQPAERESLPLMARRPEHGDHDGALYENGKRLCLIGKGSPLNKPIPGFVLYRIADTDEHGLPVIPRTADMPEDVTHMTLHTRRFFRAGELQARSVEGDEGLARIEDFNEHAQHG